MHRISEISQSRLPADEIQALCIDAERSGLALSDIESICAQLEVRPETVLNELSLSVAQGYVSGTLSYEFCDDVMNGIVNALVDLGMEGDFPQPAFALYQAFDEGQWHRSSDLPDADPGEKYTRPFVLEILRNLDR